MDEPYRLQILKRLTAHLEGINGIDPYYHDVKGKVFRGVAMFGANTPLPCLSILEGKASDYGNFADELQTVRLDSWLLLVQGWVNDDVRNPTDPGYYLAADVTRRLSDIIALNEHGKPKYSGVYLLNGLISSLTVAAPIVRPPEDNLSTKAFFYLPIQVGLKSDLTKP